MDGKVIETINVTIDEKIKAFEEKKKGVLEEIRLTEEEIGYLENGGYDEVTDDPVINERNKNREIEKKRSIINTKQVYLQKDENEHMAEIGNLRDTVNKVTERMNEVSEKIEKLQTEGEKAVEIQNKAYTQMKMNDYNPKVVKKMNEKIVPIFTEIKFLKARLEELNSLTDPDEVLKFVEDSSVWDVNAKKDKDDKDDKDKKDSKDNKDTKQPDEPNNSDDNNTPDEPTKVDDGTTANEPTLSESEIILDETLATIKNEFEQIKADFDEFEINTLNEINTLQAELDRLEEDKRNAKSVDENKMENLRTEIKNKNDALNSRKMAFQNEEMQYNKKVMFLETSKSKIEEAKATIASLEVQVDSLDQSEENEAIKLNPELAKNINEIKSEYMKNVKFLENSLDKVNSFEDVNDIVRFACKNENWDYKLYMEQQKQQEQQEQGQQEQGQQEPEPTKGNDEPKGNEEPKGNNEPKEKPQQPTSQPTQEEVEARMVRRGFWRTIGSAIRHPINTIKEIVKKIRNFVYEDIEEIVEEDEPKSNGNGNNKQKEVVERVVIEAAKDEQQRPDGQQREPDGHDR